MRHGNKYRAVVCYNCDLSVIGRDNYQFIPLDEIETDSAEKCADFCTYYFNKAEWCGDNPMLSFDIKL